VNEQEIASGMQGAEPVGDTVSTLMKWGDRKICGLEELSKPGRYNVVLKTSPPKQTWQLPHCGTPG